jgi:tRNA wybutosine-synthesizing protein 4
MKDVAGMTFAECFNMSQVYTLKLDPKERARIEKLEIFDEFEEWELLSKHYCVCLGKRISDPEIES